MEGQQTWPVCYLVTIRSSLGQIRKLHVLTWLGPEKAIAMATHADGHGYGTSDGIYHIAVEQLGPAERDEHGHVVIGTDLFDRLEF